MVRSSSAPLPLWLPLAPALLLLPPPAGAYRDDAKAELGPRRALALGRAASNLSEWGWTSSSLKRFLGKYFEKEKELGEGSFGRAFLVRATGSVKQRYKDCEPGKKYVIKAFLAHKLRDIASAAKRAGRPLWGNEVAKQQKADGPLHVKLFLRAVHSLEATKNAANENAELRKTAILNLDHYIGEFTRLQDSASYDCEVIQDVNKKEIPDHEYSHEYSEYFPRCLYNGVQSALRKAIEKWKAQHHQTAGMQVPSNIPPDYLVLEYAGAMPEDMDPNHPSGKAKQIYQTADYSWTEFVQKPESTPLEIAKAYYDIMRQALKALSFLEDAKYIHHDLKMDNVVLRIFVATRKKKPQIVRPQLRIIDFGGMMPSDDKKLLETPFATNYAYPPEYDASWGAESKGKPNEAMFDWKFPEAYDLYMMGGILVELLTGQEWVSLVPYAMLGWHDKAGQDVNNKLFTRTEVNKEYWNIHDEWAEKQETGEIVKLRLLWTKAVCCTAPEDKECSEENGDFSNAISSQDLTLMVVYMHEFGNILTGNTVNIIIDNQRQDKPVFEDDIKAALHLKQMKEAVNRRAQQRQQPAQAGGFLGCFAGTRGTGRTTAKDRYELRVAPKQTEEYEKVFQSMEPLNGFRHKLMEVLGKMLSWEPATRGKAQDLLHEEMDQLEHILFPGRKGVVYEKAEYKPEEEYDPKEEYNPKAAAGGLRQGFRAANGADFQKQVIQKEEYKYNEKDDFRAPKKDGGVNMPRSSIVGDTFNKHQKF